eukprot:153838_1
MYILCFQHAWSFTIFHLLSTAVHCVSIWEAGSQYLPQDDNNMVIGKWNDTIYFLGGDNHPWHLFTFTPAGDFSDYGLRNFNHIIKGDAQSYAQLNHILYMIGLDDTPEINTIYTYDMKTNILKPGAYTIPTYIRSDACLASTTDYLFVIGGTVVDLSCGLYCALDLVQPFNLVSRNWSKPLHMNVPRRSLSCIAYPKTNTIYAVAGDDGDKNIATIEKYTIDSKQSNWQYVDGSLTKGFVSSRCAIYDDNIYIIGGYTNGLFSDVMHIIDTTTNNVFASPDTLPYEVAATAVIVVDDVLYAFGGNNDKYTSKCLNTYVYYMPTLHPSTNPSRYPSTHPSTKQPSLPPTTHPTKHPSINPSIYPSIRPSTHPRKYPSEHPTINPSIRPSLRPSIHPTLPPTKGSSKHPSQHTITDSSTTGHPKYSTTETSETHNHHIPMIICVSITCGVIALIVCIVKRKSQRTKVNNPTYLPLIPWPVQPPTQPSNIGYTLNDSVNRLIKLIAMKTYDKECIDHIDIKLALHDFYYVWQTFERNETSLPLVPITICNEVRCIVYARNQCRVQLDDTDHKMNENNDEYSSIIKQKAVCAIIDKIHCALLHPNIETRSINSTRTKKYNQLNYELKRIYDDISKMEEKQPDHEHKQNLFHFGWEFMYEENNGGHEDQKYIQPHYHSLKDEVTQNDVRMTIQSYDIAYKKAKHYYDCKYQGVLSDVNGSEMQLYHVLALSIYCNYDIIQFEFSKTYRNWQDHKKYFHFGKTMKEAVQWFGTTIKHGTRTEFYHGINQLLVPPVFVGDLGKGISNYCPLSTSSVQAVAESFARNDGLIITFGGHTSTARYFSLAELSQYTYEREYLFLQNKQEMQITNIVRPSPYMDYKETLDGLKVLDRILEQTRYDIHENIGFTIKILNHQLKLNSNIEDKSGYAQRLLDVYFKNKDKMNINCQILLKEYAAVFELLCTNVNMSSNHWVKFDVLKQLFPNIRVLNMTTDNLWSYIQMKQNLDENQSLLNSWKLRQMVIEVTNKPSSESFNSAKNNDYVNYKIEVDGNEKYGKLEITFINKTINKGR